MFQDDPLMNTLLVLGLVILVAVMAYMILKLISAGTVPKPSWSPAVYEDFELMVVKAKAAGFPDDRIQTFRSIVDERNIFVADPPEGVNMFYKALLAFKMEPIGLCGLSSASYAFLLSEALEWSRIQCGEKAHADYLDALAERAMNAFNNGDHKQASTLLQLINYNGINPGDV